MGERQFHFPIADSDRPNLNRSTYISIVTGVTSYVRSRAVAFVEGKPICVAGGYFEIILYPKPGSLLASRHQHGRVRLLFSHTNLYLQAFKAQGIWHNFSDVDLDILPQGAMAQQHAARYQFRALRFQSTYGRKGMNSALHKLSVSCDSFLEIYLALSQYNPDNHMLVPSDLLKKMMYRCCAMFPEAVRFPTLASEEAHVHGYTARGERRRFARPRVVGSTVPALERLLQGSKERPRSIRGD
uniref:rRNA N-glycosylase n=1 Tax=Leersia perrieri TaxID=77586 RepID=A0A0D9WCN7_9ORYZ